MYGKLTITGINRLQLKAIKPCNFKGFSTKLKFYGVS